MSTTTLRRFHPAAPWLLLILLSAGMSLAAILWPLVIGALMVLLVLTIAAARALSGLRAWQQITLIGLLGYIVLGYGFANLTLPGIPVPVGHVLMVTGLLLALPGRGADIRTFMREPAAWCWLGLVGLTVLHLVAEIPVYSIWALRDSNFVLEGVFLLSGFLWARSRLGFPSMLPNLLLIFLINFFYSLTFPVSEQLIAISPRSGVFLDVPLLGTYWHNTIFLLCGALFVFLLGKQAFGWSPLMVAIMALLQLLWSLYFQMRTTYVAIVVSVVILALTGGVRRAAKAVGGVVITILVIGALGILGIGFEGRFGSLTPELIVQHVRSLLLTPDTPGVGTAEWRVDQMPQVMARWTASASTIAIGEGFGQALTDLEVSPDMVTGGVGTGVQVRAPHNTTITVLARLGLVGLLFWLLMHARITYLLVRAIRAASRGTVAHGFAVWMLAFYALAMLYTSAQPWLEFPHGAIPFYALIGFGMGLMGGDTANTHRPAALGTHRG